MKIEKMTELVEIAKNHERLKKLVADRQDAYDRLNASNEKTNIKTAFRYFNHNDATQREIVLNFDHDDVCTFLWDVLEIAKSALAYTEQEIEKLD